MITLHQEDGEKPETKRYWGQWDPGEVKKVSFKAHNYQRLTVNGDAIGPPALNNETVTLKVDERLSLPQK